ncbi:hypothetical protein ACPV3A_30555 [Paenibacillus sp. Dod16]
MSSTSYNIIFTDRAYTHGPAEGISGKQKQPDTNFSREEAESAVHTRTT